MSVDVKVTLLREETHGWVSQYLSCWDQKKACCIILKQNVENRILFNIALKSHELQKVVLSEVFIGAEMQLFSPSTRYGKMRLLPTNFLMPILSNFSLTHSWHSCKLSIRSQVSEYKYIPHFFSLICAQKLHQFLLMFAPNKHVHKS